MNAGPTGFRGAPLSKALLLASIPASIIIQASKGSTRRQVPLLVDGFTHVFVFRSPGELLFSSALLYYFRLFERQYGTAKYASYVTAVLGASYVLEALLAAGFGKPAASGLYPLVFANLISFLLDVPALHKFSVLGCRMTDKAFIYVAALQLLLLAPYKSVLAGLCGAIAGVLYRLNFLGMRKFRLPTLITDLFTRALGRVLTTPAAANLQWAPARAPPTQPVGPTPPAASALPHRTQEPSREALEQLMNMGFDRSRAAQALRQTNNNVELAVQLLL